jgi:hypothetical protein
VRIGFTRENTAYGLPVRHAVDKHVEALAGEIGHRVAQAIRHREDALAQRHPRQHLVHQIGGALGHPAAAATWTEPASLARERHQMLEGAPATSEAREPLEHPIRQELPELPLDEPRQAATLAGLRRLAQEGLQVLADDLMEHGVLGVARSIHGLDTCHSPG